MRAIVLSGGGSKGAYQIGVWKALRKLKIKYDLVTGSSVGALNAALLVQNKYYKSLYFWSKIKFSDVIDEEIDDNSSKEIIYKKYFKAMLNGGMNTNNLKKTLMKVISLKKIYKSKINIGIVTVRSSKFKPVLLKKQDIKKNEFFDYLIASASCFPAFSKKKIGEYSYIDGGIYDNLPINLAIDMGATGVIAVDLEEIGIKRKVKNKNIPITYISPNNDIGSFLIFNSKIARKSIRFGYNDTMKKFNKLDGNIFTFKKNEVSKYYKKYKSIFKNIIENNGIDVGIYKKIKEDKNWEKDFLKMLENLGQIYELDETLIYSIKKFNKILLKKINNTYNNFDTKIINKKELIKNLFVENKEKNILIFPKEYMMVIYLNIISKNY